jgi:hypothetical protein
MQNSYTNQTAVLQDAPPVNEEQIAFMQDLNFAATARKGSWVLWELRDWPEVCIWLQGFQSKMELSVKYVMMQVFKAGIDSGKVFQVNEFRLNLGMPVMTRDDIQRLSSFEHPWLGIEMNPRHGRHES